MSHRTPQSKKPRIQELGGDALLKVSPVQIFLAVIAPFFFTTAYFIFAAMDLYPAAILMLVLLSYFSYGSVSHDLVHRAYRLPPKLNQCLLSSIELLCLRSGVAYQLVHLKHHQCFPSHEDIEGKAAHMTFLQALLYGVLFQPIILRYALKHHSANKRLLLIEVALIAGIWACALVLRNTYPALLIYCVVIHVGSWIIPLMTSYFPHRSEGDDEYALTKRFRGKLFALLSLEHLYHLEHHLYPTVPHQNWPELARKLDPHLDAKKVKSIVLLK